MPLNSQTIWPPTPRLRPDTLAAGPKVCGPREGEGEEGKGHDATGGEERKRRGGKPGEGRETTGYRIGKRNGEKSRKKKGTDSVRNLALSRFEIWGDTVEAAGDNAMPKRIAEARA